MPRRKQAEEEEAQEQEAEVTEEQPDGEEPAEEDIEQEVEDQTGSSGIDIRIGEDTVQIDLPRDGNEDKNLKALAQLLKGIS